MNGRKYVNIGITHSENRGHHKNTPIHDPSDWKKTSYARDDVSADPKSSFSEEMKELKLNPKDRKKIQRILDKYAEK